MRLKKANACLSILSMICLLAHIATCVYSYIAFIYMPGPIRATADSAAVFITVHAFISLYLVFCRGDGFRIDRYPRQNIGTHIQRIAALAILLMLIPHFKAFGILMYMQTTGQADNLKLFMLSEAVFYALVILHIAVSFSKALITFGVITSEQAIKKTDRIVYVIAIIIYIIAVYSILKTQTLMFIG